MKKRGYTLAEALIAMGLVGVIAAIMLPMVNKMRPDATKAMFIKAYDSVVEATRAISSDTSIFAPSNDNNDIYLTCPLMNTDAITANMYYMSYSGGNKKFCEALGYALNAESVSSCTNDNGIEVTTFSKTFSTPNGMDFMVRTHRTISPSKYEYLTRLWVDVNGSDDGDNCWWGQTGCDEPDIFLINIYADGEVAAADAYGRTYLRTRSNLKKVKNFTPDSFTESTDLRSKDIIPNDNCKLQSSTL